MLSLSVRLNVCLFVCYHELVPLREKMVQMKESLEYEQLIKSIQHLVFSILIFASVYEWIMSFSFNEHWINFDWIIQNHIESFAMLAFIAKKIKIKKTQNNSSINIFTHNFFRFVYTNEWNSFSFSFLLFIA